MWNQGEMQWLAAIKRVEEWERLICTNWAERITNVLPNSQWKLSAISNKDGVLIGFGGKVWGKGGINSGKTYYSFQSYIWGFHIGEQLKFGPLGWPEAILHSEELRSFRLDNWHSCCACKPVSGKRSRCAGWLGYRELKDAKKNIRACVYLLLGEL